MPATFDGVNLVITLPAGASEVDAKIDLYSDWKEWFKTAGNSKYPLAFETEGGRPTTTTGKASAFFYFQNGNGWRIRPAEEDREVVITGNLYPSDTTLPMFIPTIGAYTTAITVERDASSVVETVTSGSGLSATQDERLTRIEKFLRNKTITDPATGKQTVFDDDGTSVLAQGDLFEDAAGAQPYRGQGAERRERLA